MGSICRCIDRSFRNGKFTVAKDAFTMSVVTGSSGFALLYDGLPPSNLRLKIKDLNLI